MLYPPRDRQDAFSAENRFENVKLCERLVDLHTYCEFKIATGQYRFEMKINEE